MTNEEISNMYKQLQEYWGDALVDFEHYPRQFAYQVKLYRYYKEKQNEDRSM